MATLSPTSAHAPTNTEVWSGEYASKVALVTARRAMQKKLDDAFALEMAEGIAGNPYVPNQNPGNATTGVTAGSPGSFGGDIPANLGALKALGNLGQTTAWTTGQSVLLGDASAASWDGTTWVVGAAPAPPVDPDPAPAPAPEGNIGVDVDGDGTVDYTVPDEV